MVILKNVESLLKDFREKTEQDTLKWGLYEKTIGKTAIGFCAYEKFGSITIEHVIKILINRKNTFTIKTVRREGSGVKINFVVIRLGAWWRRDKEVYSLIESTINSNLRWGEPIAEDNRWSDLAEAVKKKQRVSVEKIVLRIQLLSAAKPDNTWVQQCTDLYRKAVLFASQCFPTSDLANLIFSQAKFLQENNQSNEAGEALLNLLNVLSRERIINTTVN